MSMQAPCLSVLLAGVLSVQVAFAPSTSPGPADEKDELPPALRAMVDAARNAKAPADADALTRLKVERLNALGDAISVRFTLYQLGKAEATLDGVVGPARMCRDAGLALTHTPQERLAWLERYLEVTRLFEKSAAERLKAGVGLPSEATLARAIRLDAQIQVAEAKANRPKPEKE